MKVLVTVNITKGFDTWLAMSQTMTEEAAKNGIKMIWAATNPDETSVFRADRNAGSGPDEDLRGTGRHCKSAR